MPLLALLAACGAEGTEAPVTEPPTQTCPGVDDRLDRLLTSMRAGELDALEPVLDRLATEREGVRLERALQFVLGLLQALPRRVASGFEYELVYELLDETREPAMGILDFLSEGPPDRRAVFSILGDMFGECPRDSIILTINDVFEDPDLLDAAGEALSDPLVVGLLANIPTSDASGREGFIALIATVLNAVQSPNFDFAEVRQLVGFLDIDEPPVSGLLDALERFLTGERLQNLRTTIGCLESQTWNGLPGEDVLGGFLYDLVTLEELDLGAFLSLAAPFLEQLKAPDVQTLLKAIIDRLLEDVELRTLGVELIVFFLREDNIQPVLQAATVAVRTGAIDDVLRLFEGLSKLCPGALSASGS